MAFAGMASIPNYDSTAQTSGVPISSARSNHHEEEDIAAANQNTVDTAATSITEVAGSDKAPKKSATPFDSDKISAEGEDEDSEMERRHSLVQSLARKYSHASATGTVRGNPFFADETSPLNPNSPDFNGRAWARAMVDLVQQNGASFRTSGVAFQNLNVFGFGQATDYQKDVGNIWLSVAGLARKLTGGGGKTRIDILRNFDGLVRKGEMLVVLGPPGSGCSTFLKTIAGETNGLYTDDSSYFNYQGMTSKEMHTQHRGEAIYTAEVDVHFPQLSVGDTLTFAARARQPRQLPEGISSNDFAQHLRDVVMAMFGISHTVNTRVGNEYIRGVSGGERKRVTIAEAALSGAPLQCWDNSTRGLDSANAIEFCKTLRLQTELFDSTACVSIYQAPQSAYDLFDKVAVLYEGRQIFFGKATDARQYFIDLGYDCPARATTPDFLTSMTSPQERHVRPGWENKAPRTPDEFATAWKNSANYTALQAEIEEYKQTHPLNGPDAEAFRASKKAQQAKGQRAKSPFTLSYAQQIKLCLWRGWRRLIGDPSITVGSLIGNVVMGLIIGSVFYNLQQDTQSFFQRGALLFFALLMNAFSSALEILTLYAQRPIVEKHSRYALYHPSAEAVASMLCDMPYKVMNTIVFNLVLYFMTNLRREPGAFFFFLLMSFFTVLTMSMIFRTIASSSRTLSQAMVPAAILILDLVIFTGFVIPIDYMLDWCRWLNYLDPLAYSFESLIVNEFHGRNFACSESQFVPRSDVPGYANLPSAQRVCSAVGSVAGLDYVSGDDYVGSGFRYSYANRWRNFGILIAFMLFFLMTYMVTAELVSEKKSKGEVLVFRRGHKPAALNEKHTDDPEDIRVGPVTTADRARINEKNDGLIEEQKSTFHWNDVCYEVQIKNETRRILDHVDGWVKPGTLTALMGVSGAGKTTLLDCLADRTSMGVITGEMLVDGYHRDASFQRKTGYVQQQDLHLQTTTVREALNFSALLRQPEHVPRQEKLDYVEEVIKLLDMEEYADAVVGVPGEGLNVEQRKRLTIGVELVAKPPLLLFVDEPTSGLDSQTSWAILDLLEKLTKSGQAILCTIHQPSAMLFQRFDRLLFLAKGGRTVYFGDIGENSKVMTSYFERISGMTCPHDANPAEWMLEVIGAAPGSHTDVDWHQAWRKSEEFQGVQAELQRLKDERGVQTPATHDKGSYREFAAPFFAQLKEVTHRVFQQYWRTPSYIYAKAALCTLVAAFIGFVFFKAPNTQQGLQNQMFAIFNLLTVFGQLVQQTMPHFVIQRSLYEVRERPSKVYGWKVFMLSQIIVELPWNTLMAAIMYFCWYYPVGLYQNAIPADQVTERGALMFLYLLVFLLFTSTFTDFIIAGFETAEAGGNIANLLFMLCLIFCGVLANPDSIPRFWIFMYRVSPFTYIVSGMLSTAVANTEVVCAANEFLHFDPPSGQSCGAFLENYITAAGGYLREPNATTDCQFCTIQDTNVFLASVKSDYNDRWRNFGIAWVYIIFNIFAALGLYWLARVPKKGGLFGKKKTE
ncbi:ABC-2 type transporter [Colletotrichum scovillei]|uniref:ABC-2 type transporter n=1 Tax=Colletotrichum scovillei TaxID=1209932 RepID=A0A9P7QU56_9PEZI|nr:ABC-2 type transporter [Colletotrichum scovillei]KAF4780777.1 ABC-2 type transporter [Colletotrichum scovillei]KAG7039316.1 ABC-2 type transporter [Colletotrichum scovillei]KAG7041497.1 ABC-2 type transporter [Colletotrichum scovillei]KAG7061525.1 ABC-2 type transporter [Colletotrichum scovillei]